MRTRSLLIALLLVAPTTAVRAQGPDSAATPGTGGRGRGGALPLVPTRNVRFTTDEGTWMSVDVSPDGRTVIFDLLGDIYTVPITGGKATRVTSGNTIDAQPRFSPDGRQIVFVSDRNGTDATWIAGADGRGARMLTAGGMFPAFTPDGRYVVSGTRLVDLQGGSGIQLQGLGTGVSFTADGRYIWYQNGTQAGRYDRQTGTHGYRTNVAGGVLRPLVSRDGKSLLYFTGFEGRTALVQRDIETGADRWILMGTQDEAGVPGGAGALPTSAWLPDGSAIITSFGGKLWRVAIPSGQTTPIPFTADVDQALGPLVRGSYEIRDSVTVREIRDPALSPDGNRVAFTAAGKVWVMDLPTGAPRRLTRDSVAVESFPVWSPDGRTIAYATWVDAIGGDIYEVDAGGGAARNLTRAPAMYARINYTPDGSRLVFARAPRQARTMMVDEAVGGRPELGYELRWMPRAGGAQTPITMVADAGAFPLGGYPHFTTDTSRVFFHDGTALVSVRWDGSDEQTVLAGAAPQTLIARDGIHVMTKTGRRRQIYLFELPRGVGDSLTIDPAGNAPVPTRRLTRAGGDFPSFTADGSRAVWSNGTSLYVYDVARGDRATSDSVTAAIARLLGADSTRRPPAAAGGGAPADSGTRWAPAFDATRYDVAITLPADRPSGTIVLRGARVITMKGSEVIENADLVVTDNRIAAVGRRGTITIPRGARTIDVAGRTILPGFVDLNAQLSAPSQLHRTVVSQYLANLAFGVTTVRDPQTAASDIFTYADRAAIGDLLGPRVFATGQAVLDSAARIATLAEGRDFMGLYASSYRTNTVRGDLAATRADRQRFLMVARELGLTAVAIGAPNFRRSLTAILDGYAEHHGSYEIFPLGGDVTKLFAESGTTYIPLMLGRILGNRPGYDYIVATENPHLDPKLRRFYHHRDLDRITRANTPWVSPDEYPFQDVAAGAARIVAAGGKVGLGSTGRVQGIALHWDMWLLARGGMPAHDILRSATLTGAETIGLGTQLGSIEVGKLADLQVLERNPLIDIRNTHSVRYVMKNGRLYDANTLDQVAPTPTKLTGLWWLEMEPLMGEPR